MSGQYCVDANLFITAWHTTYPPRILSPLWERIADHASDILLVQPVFDEIEPIPPSYRKLSTTELRERHPVRIWLQDSGFPVVDVNEETDRLSLKLERKYEISDEGKGAGRVDITLIAYAIVKGKTVVSLESIQNQKPNKKRNYKIPLICSEENVECIDFIKMLDQLEISIGSSAR